MPYDPARARALLERAGWMLGSDGIRHDGARALDVLLVIQAGVPGEAIAANLIAQYERAVGARVTIKQFAVMQFGSARRRWAAPVYGGKFDMALYSFVNGDNTDTTDQFGCANMPPNGYNKSRICDSRIDALLRGGASHVRRNGTQDDLCALAGIALRTVADGVFVSAPRIGRLSRLCCAGRPVQSTAFFRDVGRWRFARAG